MSEDHTEEEQDREEPSSKNQDERLTFAEARVLGCLLEKEATTPDNYPITQNALVAACNQKSNRDPVVEFDTDEVETAVEGLREKKFGAKISLSGSRVPKYRHQVDEALPGLDRAQLAILCVLLLRGAQTIGELRSRTERLFPFPDLGKAESTISELMQYPLAALVAKLPPGGGRKVVTYTHLLCGSPEESPVAAALSSSKPTGETIQLIEEQSWRKGLENEISELREEVAHLRADLAQLRSEFE